MATEIPYVEPPPERKAPRRGRRAKGSGPVLGGGGLVEFEMELEGLEGWRIFSEKQRSFLHERARWRSHADCWRALGYNRVWYNLSYRRSKRFAAAVRWVEEKIESGALWWAAKKSDAELGSEARQVLRMLLHDSTQKASDRVAIAKLLMERDKPSKDDPAHRRAPIAPQMETGYGEEEDVEGQD